MRFAIVLLTCVALWLSSAQPARAQVTADDVRTAIERGVNYLLRDQAPDGRWSEYNEFPGGVTALCTLALLNSGVPVDDPKLQRALNHLRKIEPQKTYTVALQTMVLCAAEPDRDRALIRRNVQWLEKTQIKSGVRSGGWGYPDAAGDGSNSQFALLALHEAERVGVSATNQTWRLALDYWLERQNGDGSWFYNPGAAATGSMTCAGIGSVVIAASKLNPPDARVVGGKVQCCADQEHNSAVERGLNWLGAHFTLSHNPGLGPITSALYDYYYIYGVERVGRLTAQRFIGDHDWYREGCDQLVRQQDKLSGFWRGAGPRDGTQILTSFALLFLAKGRRPVLIAKLEREPFDDWNRHRHDLANLTAYVESRWKRDLAWQVVDFQQPDVNALLQSPVIFINGRDRPRFTPEQLKALREYLDRGGFLFAEACCDGTAFDTGFREAVSQMFPEPERRLYLLPPDHAVWHAEEPVDAKSVRPLWGLDVGCRTSIIYCPEDLSCYWELSRAGRDQNLDAQTRAQIAAANSIGINVLAYATNRQLKYKYEVPTQPTVPEKSDDNVARAKIELAQLRHTGGWNAAPGALVNLQRILSDEVGLRIDTDEESLAITDAQLFRHHLVLMHGRNEFRLTEAERAQLQLYLERGGMILADAVCASEAFTRAFRREIGGLFPEQPLERIPVEHPLFTNAFGGFDLSTVERRDPQENPGNQPLAARVRKVPPELEGIELEGRYAVIFSPFDLSCALEQHESLDCRGYTRADAARIAINVVLYSLHE